MASILIIESHPILREALRQFLFPEHQTLTRDRWAGPGDLQRHDLVIVDRETVEDGGRTVEALRALQRLKVPSVWLHQGPAPPFKPGRLTETLAKPVEGPALESAVRSLLEDAPAPRKRARRRPDETPVDEPADGGGIIELTDVVEEGDPGEPDDPS